MIDLTETQRRALILVRDTEPTSQTAVGSAFGISSNGAKKILTALQNKGMIEMTPFERESVKISEAGKEYVSCAPRKGGADEA